MPTQTTGILKIWFFELTCYISVSYIVVSVVHYLFHLLVCISSLVTRKTKIMFLRTFFFNHLIPKLLILADTTLELWTSSHLCFYLRLDISRGSIDFKLSIMDNRIPFFNKWLELLFHIVIFLL